MADLFCTFLDFRSLITNYKVPLILPSKHFYSSALRSHNSRTSRIKGRQLHFTLLSASSSSSSSSAEFDVISTHEHSDGSVLFRFGDPNEVAKNVKTGESKTVKEEIEGEDVPRIVKVVDDDDETEGIEKKADREVEDASRVVKIVDNGGEKKGIENKADEEVQNESGAVKVVDNDDETGGIENKLDREVEDEFCALKVVDNDDVTKGIAKKTDREVEDGSRVVKVVGNDVETKETEKKADREVEDESRVVKVVYNDNGKEGTEKKTDREVTGSSLTEEGDHANSILSSSKTIGVVEGESESSKKLLEGSSDTELPVLTSSEEMKGTSTPDVDIEHIENVEEGLNEKYKASSPVESFILDEVSKVESDIAIVENNSTTSEFLEKANAEAPSMTDPNIAVPENGVPQASLGTIVTPDDSPIYEHKNVETDVQIETTEDGKESFDSNLVSSSPQSEPAIKLSKEIEEQNSQAEMQKVAIGNGSKNDMNDIEALEIQNVMGNGNAADTCDTEAKSTTVEDMASGAGSGMQDETVEYVSEKVTIQLMTMPPQLDVDSVLEEETGIGTMEESREDDGSKNLKMGGDLVEASVHEATVTESTPTSQEMLTTNFVLSSGAALLTHPSKVLTGGEDAYFISGQTWLGVADGVSIWSFEGTYPGVYAQELIKICERLISVENGDSIKNPVELLNLSVAETDSLGSTTALIAQFDGQALHVANVGDSGFIVLRHGSVHKRSSPMHHAFHFPVQIERGDDPSSLAEFYRVDLEEGDVIITATDGLLDNLYDQEISLIVMKSLAADKKLQDIAKKLALKAQERGSSASAKSPFADNAQAAGFAGYTGGKLDDVAVIVSVVRRQ